MAKIGGSCGRGGLDEDSLLALRVHVQMRKAHPKVVIYLRETRQREVANKPFLRKARDLFQGAWFLEEVRCARNDHQIFGALKLTEGLAIQFNHHVVVAADNQQRRRL